ncbi:MAG: hydantoinase/oxoprolinase family protein [Gammaproteobacteria bacterium]|nr:hydantoinase/oxoprolinase family protein [Gammaproteobacteria bacterium]
MLGQKKIKINQCRIGIDVGGTTVDFALVDSNDYLIDSRKILITKELNQCVTDGLNYFIEKHMINREYCKSIHIGTTLAVNSLLELKSLYRVGVLRLAGHQPDLAPASDFPDLHKNIILAGYKTVSGGREFDNKEITPLQESEIIMAVNQLIEAGAESLAVIGTFSPLYPSEEKRVREIITQKIPLACAMPITLSHQLGGLDFIERENSVIINAALKKVIKKNFITLQKTLNDMGFHCPVLITQNNGTLFSLDEAIEFPVKTISSGPTNSLVGACKLTHLRNAIVVDIGGTSTDIGIVENGFPRYSSLGSVISGIPFNFLVPDIHALALGGGSIIHENSGEYTIESESIGAKIFSQSKTFLGKYLTLFDVGNVLLNLQHPNGVIPDLNFTAAETIMKEYLHKISAVINTMTDHEKLPIVLVGGGSQNIPENLLGENFVRPKHYQVANAYGAALAEISATIDTIVNLDENSESTILGLEKEALREAITKGASSLDVRIIEKSLLPFYYMPKKMTRVIVTASGPLSALSR